MNKKTKNIFKVILYFAIFMFVFLLIGVKLNFIHVFDSFFYNLLIFNKSLTSIMKGVTLLGDEIIFIPLAILLLFILKNKNTALYITINLILASSLNAIVKSIVQRPRPEGISLVIENGFSFPSGHSFTAFAFYSFLIYLIYRFVKNKYLKVTMICLLIVFVLAVGFSRVYLGVHYLSDVLAAYSLGYIYIYSFVWLYDKVEILKTKKVQ